MFSNLLYKIVIFFNTFIIVYVGIVGLFNAIQMFMALLFSLKYIRKAKFSDIKLYKDSYNMVPFSILVPARNEEKVIVQSIKSLLSLEYSTFEVIVINDGSTDKTLKTLIRTFRLKKTTFPIKPRLETKQIRDVYYNPEIPNLLLVDKENGGKSDALNAGINISHYPYFISQDADSMLDSDALVRIAMSFMEYKYTIAVGGVIRVSNGSEIKNGKVVKLALPKKPLAMFQVVEYLRAFLVGRVGWSLFNSVLIISGAFGAFQKEIVIQVGGYTTRTMGEDMDLVLKLHKHMHEKKFKYKVTFLPDPVCWTQVPESIRDLFVQRRRWQIGLIHSMELNKVMVFKRKYGVTGMLAMPYFFLFELAAPVVEALGWVFIPLSYFMGILSFVYLVLFFLVAMVFGIILSIGALIIEEFTFNKYVKLKEFFRLCFYGVIENFSYRQLTVIFRLIAIFGFRRYKHSWGEIKRSDFNKKELKRQDEKEEKSEKKEKSDKNA